MNNKPQRMDASNRAEVVGLGAFNVMVMFDDLHASERATRASCTILAAIEGDLAPHVSYWDLGCVCAISAVQQGAASCARKADLVILALSDPVTSPSIQSFLDACIAQANELFILALFGAEEVWTIRFQIGAGSSGVAIGSWIPTSDRKSGLDQEAHANESFSDKFPGRTDEFTSGSPAIPSSLSPRWGHLELTSVAE
jgi:hypothetical protein